MEQYVVRKRVVVSRKSTDGEEAHLQYIVATATPHGFRPQVESKKKEKKKLCVRKQIIGENNAK